MILIEDKINLEDLKRLAQETFGNMIKAVVDIEKEVMVGAMMHADEEAFLLKQGSKQTDL